MNQQPSTTKQVKLSSNKPDILNLNLCQLSVLPRKHIQGDYNCFISVHCSQPYSSVDISSQQL